MNEDILNYVGSLKGLSPREAGMIKRVIRAQDEIIQELKGTNKALQARQGEQQGLIRELLGTLSTLDQRVQASNSALINLGDQMRDISQLILTTLAKSSSQSWRSADLAASLQQPQDAVDRSLKLLCQQNLVKVGDFAANGSSQVRLTHQGRSYAISSGLIAS